MLMTAAQVGCRVACALPPLQLARPGRASLRTGASLAAPGLWSHPLVCPGRS